MFRVVLDGLWLGFVARGCAWHEVGVVVSGQRVCSCLCRFTLVWVCWMRVGDG